MTRYWISPPLSFCGEESFSSSPSRVCLACSPSRKSRGSTGNLPSHCSPTVIRPTTDPLSWPLFQISARHFSLQGKETNSAAMASALRMRTHISGSGMKEMDSIFTSSLFQARHLKCVWLVVLRNTNTNKIVTNRFNRNFLDHWNTTAIIVEFSRAKRAQRSTMGKKMWQTTYSRKFGNHVTVHRTIARPSVSTTGIPM